MAHDHPWVQLVKVTGVTNASHLRRAVQQRYPQARMQGMDTSAWIAIPDLVWSLAPGGDRDFFCELSRAGLIRDYAHRVRTDWPGEAQR